MSSLASITPFRDTNAGGRRHAHQACPPRHLESERERPLWYLSRPLPGSALSHAAYLGRELTKAELSLSAGFTYVQDGASLSPGHRCTSVASQWPLYDVSKNCRFLSCTIVLVQLGAPGVIAGKF